MGDTGTARNQPATVAGTPDVRGQPPLTALHLSQHVSRWSARSSPSPDAAGHILLGLSHLSPTVLLMEDFDRSVVEAASWRLASELVRRHPTALRLIRGHPGGGQS